ncbi:metallophosphoesterase [Acidobacteria bacterium AH-259-D05]|nr:metallophosphoesterase [Acidobacteria bacterium AH-259-D05]
MSFAIGALLLWIVFSAASPPWTSQARSGKEDVQLFGLSPMPFTLPSDEEHISSFSFIVYGDIQENYRNSHQALIEHMLKEEAAFVINTGDISRDMGKYYLRDFYPVIQVLAEQIPYFPVIGNHDVTWGSPVSRYRFSNFFHRAHDYLAKKEINAHLVDPTTQKLWYSFTYGDVLFIILDSNLFIDEGRYQKTHALRPYQTYLKEQMIWVRDLLRNSSRDPRIKARFVFFHHSPFVSDELSPVPFLGTGGHPGHSHMVVNQRVPSGDPGKTLYLLDLFRKHRVTAVFTGHEHYYERWQETIFENKRPIHLLNWVVSGVGGTKPRGHPEYKQGEIEELLEEGKVYRDYVDRINELNANWSADFQHHYPNRKSQSGLFHNYILVTVSGSEVRFLTRDKLGEIRDQGYFSLVSSAELSPELWE